MQKKRKLESNSKEIMSDNQSTKFSYKIISEEEKSLMYDMNLPDLVDQVEFNKAIIELFTSGDYLLSPAEGGKSIFFSDKNEMYSMIESKTFPTETDTEYFFDRYKQEIECLKNNANHDFLFFDQKFRSIMNEKFDFSLKESFLIKLELQIMDMFKSDSKVLNEFMILSDFLIRESIRRKLNGHWKYRKIYTLNTFWEPYLVDKDNFELLLTNITEDLTYEEPLGLKYVLTMYLDSYLSNKFSDIEFNQKEIRQNLLKDFGYYSDYYLKIAGQI